MWSEIKLVQPWKPDITITERILFRDRFYNTWLTASELSTQSSYNCDDSARPFLQFPRHLPNIQGSVKRDVISIVEKKCRWQDATLPDDFKFPRNFTPMQRGIFWYLIVYPECPICVEHSRFILCWSWSLGALRSLMCHYKLCTCLYHCVGPHWILK